MVSGIEGVGEVVTGGAIARALEPEAGAARDGTPEGNCLNCGAALAGPYCHECGQKGHVHRTLGAFWHDLLHGVLHIEGKIWRTLPLLAWRPGEITRRYVDGERAKFVSPMALFLFSVFLMFAVFSTIGGPFAFSANPQARAQARAEAEQEFNAARADRVAELGRRRAERGRLAATGRPTAAIDADIRNRERRLRAEQEIFRRTLSLTGAEPAGSAAGKAGRADDPDRLDVEVSERPSNVAWINRAYLKARENPSLLIYKVQTNAYKFSWLLIPISLPFVWLLFLHRRRYRQFKAYDHVVFVTYSIAFMSLLLIALSLLRPLGIGRLFIGLAIAFVPPIHIYRQLRGAYRLSRLSALWRTALLLFFAAIAATIFFVLLLALGVLG